MQWKASYLALFITASLTITPAFAKQSADNIAPEAATGLKTQTLVQGSDWMIASANPYASEAGAAMLRQGGMPLMPWLPPS
jgi:gamma-glutamyltranspeptidase / glutathione hydrolase